MAEQGSNKRPEEIKFTAVDAFLDEIDERIAHRYRFRLGCERKLVSLTKLENGRWRARLSVDRYKRMRFVREGYTRVRALENANKAYADLLKLLLGRGRFQAANPPWPDEQ